jgi:hypothetical protein
MDRFLAITYKHIQIHTHTCMQVHPHMHLSFFHSQKLGITLDLCVYGIVQRWKTLDLGKIVLYTSYSKPILS